MAERTIPLNELHRRTDDLVEEARASDEPLYITAHGRPSCCWPTRFMKHCWIGWRTSPTWSACGSPLANRFARTTSSW